MDTHKCGEPGIQKAKSESCPGNISELTVRPTGIVKIRLIQDNRRLPTLVRTELTK